MAQKLFEVAILYHEPDKNDTNQNVVKGKSKIIKEPYWELAANDKEVGVRAARSIPDEYLDKLDEVEIIIRPFN